MDQPLRRSARLRLRAPLRWLLGITAVIVAAIWLARGSAALRVDRAALQLATVTRGTFEDFIPLTGEVVPPETVLLDAVEGGRIERILVEDGARVTAGQPLVQLSNPAIQLDVISRETQLTEQLNNLRNSELVLEQTRVALEREQVDLEYQAKKSKRNAAMYAALSPEGAVARADDDDAQDAAVYYARRVGVLRRAQAIDEQMRRRQLGQLKESEAALTRNMEFTHRQLEHLEVRAPIDGTLTALDVRVGQSVARGARLGQIDVHGAFKLAAKVDQFYAGRVVVGQRATLAMAGHDYALTVAKVYPRVDAGRFTIDLTFREPPPELRRGQTLQLRLFVGEAVETLLIPNGAYLERTAGNWVFVLAGASAARRAVQLGRKNPRFVEVLGGLAAGETVVVSSYNTYGDATAITLD
jgi:HlyD family secretion protein